MRKFRFFFSFFSADKESWLSLDQVAQNLAQMCLHVYSSERESAIWKKRYTGVKFPTLATSSFRPGLPADFAQI